MKNFLILWLCFILIGLYNAPRVYAYDIPTDLVPPVIYAPALRVKPNQPVDLLEDVMVVDDVSDTNYIELIDYPETSVVTFTDAQRGIQYIEYHAYDEAGNLAVLYRPIMVGYANNDSQNDLKSPEFVTRPLYIEAGTMTFLDIANNKMNLGVIDYTDGDLINQVTLNMESTLGYDLNQLGAFKIKWQVYDQHHNPAIAYQWVIVHASESAEN